MKVKEEVEIILDQFYIDATVGTFVFTSNNINLYLTQVFKYSIKVDSDKYQFIRALRLTSTEMKLLQWKHKIITNSLYEYTKY